jgi:hypothetical protein
MQLRVTVVLGKIIAPLYKLYIGLRSSATSGFCIDWLLGGKWDGLVFVARNVGKTAEDRREVGGASAIHVLNASPEKKAIFLSCLEIVMWYNPRVFPSDILTASAVSVSPSNAGFRKLMLT